MLDVQAALIEVTRRAKTLGREIVPVTAALGRVLARDIRAAAPIPPFAKSAMDGYAVRSADVESARPDRPVVLEVTRDLPAGRVSRSPILSGQAARIMTGAPLPPGVDAVVMVEDTEMTTDGVLIRESAEPGENVGEAGEDVRKGEIVLTKGETIGPAAMGMLAAVGVSRVPVIRKPLVAVISTGDELVEPGEPCRPGRIRNANGYSLLGLALAAGADAAYLGIARDRAASLRTKVRKADEADVLVLSGGVSVGDYDLVKDELAGLGVAPVFWQVRMKPGKPVFFGVRGGQLVFGLPGNPSGAMVAFLVFVRPALDILLGRSRVGPRRGRAALDEEVRVQPGRVHFLRGVLRGAGPQVRVAPYPDQKSGILKSMVNSRVLIVIPPDAERLPAGHEVEYLAIE